MAPKQRGLRNLPKKGVSPKKTEMVKGGRKPKDPRISSNHSQSFLVR